MDRNNLEDNLQLPQHNLFQFLSVSYLSFLLVEQCLYICAILYDYTEIRHSGLVWPFDPYWSVVHPGSILRDASSHRAEQNVNREVMLSPRTSAVIEAAASTSGMWIEPDKPASSFSLCCVASSTHNGVPWVTGWLRLTSSKTAPLINIWAAQRCLSSPSMSSRSPFLSLGQVPGHAGLFEARLLRWSGTGS